MAQLTLTQIRKSFGAVDVLKGIDLDVRHGEFIVFVGPSGCGKSTLLRVIAGLEAASSGTIAMDGQDVTHLPASDRGLAMVFQSYALYPHMSVYKNMAFALENMALPKSEIDKRVRRAATMLRLGDYLERKPGALSGGQRQRVAIGRSIVRDPKIFLFDEPLSNLDAELRVATRKELAALHAELGGTMIYVTHDQVEAMTLANRIVVLHGGQIEQVGTPLDLYNFPSNLFVAGFIGSPRMNLLKASVTGQGKVTISGSVKALVLGAVQPLAIGETITLGIRPEHVVACTPEEADLAITLDLVEQLGGETCLYGSADNIPQMTIRLDGQSRFQRGDSVPLRLKRESIHVFDPSGQRMQSLTNPAA